MVTYSEPITPPEMGLWFNQAGVGYQPVYDEIVVPFGYDGPPLSAGTAGGIGSNDTRGLYAGSARRAVSPPGDLSGGDLSMVRSATLGEPVETGHSGTSVDQGAYTFRIYGARATPFESEFAEGMGSADLHRLAYFPVDEYGLDLQNVSNRWTPAKSGIATPEGATGWRVISGTAEIVDCWIAFQDELGPSTSGYQDPEDASRWLGVGPAPSVTGNVWPWVEQNCRSMEITQYPTVENPVQIFTRRIPPEILGAAFDDIHNNTKVTHLYSAPTMVAVAGMPPAHEAFPGFARPTNFGWEWTGNPDLNRVGGFNVAPAVHTQYLWQPPTFQWVYGTSTPTPPCRLFPRDDGLGTSSAARIFPPSKLRQRSNRPNATY